MKPTTDNFIAKANVIFEYMKAHRRYCTKEELGEVIHCGERVVRDMINYLRNLGYCICAISSKTGYKLMSYTKYTKEDEEDVINMIHEIEKRKLELESMQRCCDRFFKKAEEYKNEKKKENRTE